MFFFLKKNQVLSNKLGISIWRLFSNWHWYFRTICGGRKNRLSS